MLQEILNRFQRAPVQDDTLLDEEEVDDFLELLQAADAPTGLHGKIMNGLRFLFATFGTVVFWWLLGTGNGEFFNDFHGFNLSGQTVGAYLMGLTLEGAGVVLIITAGHEWHKKKMTLFFATITGAVFLSLLSFYTQYALLASELARNMLSFPDRLLTQLPFVNSVTGILMLRAAAPSVINFYIVFLLTDYAPDVLAAMRKQQEIQTQAHQFRQAQATMELAEAAHHMTLDVIRSATDKIAEQLTGDVLPQQQQHVKVSTQATPLQQQLPPPTPTTTKKQKVITKKGVDDLLQLME